MASWAGAASGGEAGVPAGAEGEGGEERETIHVFTVASGHM